MPKVVHTCDDPERGVEAGRSVGLIALSYYRTTNPVPAAMARRAIEETLADQD